MSGRSTRRKRSKRSLKISSSNSFTHVLDRICFFSLVRGNDPLPGSESKTDFALAYPFVRRLKCSPLSQRRAGIVTSRKSYFLCLLPVVLLWHTPALLLYKKQK